MKTARERAQWVNAHVFDRERILQWLTHKERAVLRRFAVRDWVGQMGCGWSRWGCRKCRGGEGVARHLPAAVRHLPLAGVPHIHLFLFQPFNPSLLLERHLLRGDCVYRENENGMCLILKGLHFPFHLYSVSEWARGAAFSPLFNFCASPPPVGGGCRAWAVVRRDVASGRHRWGVGTREKAGDGTGRGRFGRPEGRKLPRKSLPNLLDFGKVACDASRTGGTFNPRARCPPRAVFGKVTL